MRRSISLCGLLPLLLAAACTSAEERSARADEDVANRRLELIEQPQSCAEEAGGDQQKLEACEVYLREAEARKSGSGTGLPQTTAEQADCPCPRAGAVRPSSPGLRNRGVALLGTKPNCRGTSRTRHRKGGEGSDREGRAEG